MHLQKILLSVIMLRFYFFTAKQGTSVHNFDRGPLMRLYVFLFTVSKNERYNFAKTSLREALHQIKFIL